MWLVGCSYNFCTAHDSLRRKRGEGEGREREERTPAMAAGLTDHIWNMQELLRYRIPPPAYLPPRRRGRPPGSRNRPLKAMAA